MIADRRALRRKDPEGLAADRAAAKVIPVWRGRSLVRAGRPPTPVWLEGERAQAALGAGGEEAIYLGVDAAGAAVFAIDLSDVDDPVDALGLEDRFEDLRMAGAFMPAADFEPLAYARGICRWNRTTRFCASCGGALRNEEAGFAKSCTECDEKVFPRTDPAVMILCVRGDRCLLARQPGFPRGMVSALAGFVEPGESLEDCVRREVGEEVGLTVERLSYAASQGWPFPQSLMIGFRAEVAPGEVRLEDDELEEARWFTRAELEKPAMKAAGYFYPPPMSLAHRLVREWIAE
ncbi:MAG: NAD(+) diphosphatase [Sandaracinus sp.]|mgnify:CR=1 FL=1|nr:NAD(+) diphosphatase [Sandaracinus sp.]